jgi:hypothetical protein
MDETERVEAFIRTKQQQVLDKAVSALETADPEALRGEVHRLVGTLGTYDLADAVALLRPLDELMKSDAAGPDEQERAREEALVDLRRIRELRMGATT